MFALFQLVILCMTACLLTLIICLSLPRSELRTFLAPALGWMAAICAGLYACAPIDVMPEVLLGPLGLLDDAIVLVAGIAAARIAMLSAKKPKED